MVVFYVPEAGFTGADSLTVDVILPDGGFNKRHYAIDVRVALGLFPEVRLLGRRAFEQRAVYRVLEYLSPPLSSCRMYS